jgi:4'-phosphopantetheinyl transferase
MAQIDIFFTSFASQMEQPLFESYLSLLPPDLRERNSRYIHWQNRHSHLLGKLLLLEALKAHGIQADIWDYLAYDPYQRPFLNSYTYDFNISHSGNLVICAIGKNVRLGVDIEENKKINLSNFKNVMTVGQWDEVNKAEDPLKIFYKYWTIKESVIKADGRGFIIPLDQLEVKNNVVQYEGRQWFVKDFTFTNAYSAALASDRLSSYSVYHKSFY